MDPDIVVLTGAGISAESGIPTYRGTGGLWEGHAFQELATPEAFASNPELVHRFYNERRQKLKEISPNPAHTALAQLEQRLPGKVFLVTQNVDDLHERAGSVEVVHMHGKLLESLCTHCGNVRACVSDLSVNLTCTACDQLGSLRPNIVWFGEMPHHMDLIQQHLETATHFLSVGTSGHVYPAAGFVGIARAFGAHCIEINIASSLNADQFDEQRIGPASIELPKFLADLLEHGDLGAAHLI